MESMLMWRIRRHRKLFSFSSRQYHRRSEAFPDQHGRRPQRLNLKRSTHRRSASPTCWGTPDTEDMIAASDALSQTGFATEDGATDVADDTRPLSRDRRLADIVTLRNSFDRQMMLWLVAPTTIKNVTSFWKEMSQSHQTTETPEKPCWTELQITPASRKYRHGGIRVTRNYTYSTREVHKRPTPSSCFESLTNNTYASCYMWIDLVVDIELVTTNITPCSVQDIHAPPQSPSDWSPSQKFQCGMQDNAQRPVPPPVPTRDPQSSHVSLHARWFPCHVLWLWRPVFLHFCLHSCLSEIFKGHDILLVRWSDDFLRDILDSFFNWRETCLRSRSLQNGQHLTLLMIPILCEVESMIEKSSNQRFTRSYRQSNINEFDHAYQSSTQVPSCHFLTVDSCIALMLFALACTLMSCLSVRPMILFVLFFGVHIVSVTIIICAVRVSSAVRASLRNREHVMFSRQCARDSRVSETINFTSQFKA